MLLTICYWKRNTNAGLFGSWFDTRQSNELIDSMIFHIMNCELCEKSHMQCKQQYNYNNNKNNIDNNINNSQQRGKWWDPFSRKLLKLANLQTNCPLNFLSPSSSPSISLFTFFIMLLIIGRNTHTHTHTANTSYTKLRKGISYVNNSR